MGRLPQDEIEREKGRFGRSAGERERDESSCIERFAD